MCTPDGSYFRPFPSRPQPLRLLNLYDGGGRGSVSARPLLTSRLVTNNELYLLRIPC